MRHAGSQPLNCRRASKRDDPFGHQPSVAPDQSKVQNRHPSHRLKDVLSNDCFPDNAMHHLTFVEWQ